MAADPLSFDFSQSTNRDSVDTQLLILIARLLILSLPSGVAPAVNTAALTALQTIVGKITPKG